MTTSENDRSTALETDQMDSANRNGTPPASPTDDQHVAQNAKAPDNDLTETRSAEYGGQAGLEPTRYGDWEKKGRCTDF